MTVMMTFVGARSSFHLPSPRIPVLLSLDERTGARNGGASLPMGKDLLRNYGACTYTLSVFVRPGNCLYIGSSLRKIRRGSFQTQNYSSLGGILA